MKKTIIMLFFALAATHVQAMGFGEMMAGTVASNCGQIGVTTIFFDAHARGYFKHFDNLQSATTCFDGSIISAQLFGDRELDADAGMENRLNLFYDIYHNGLYVALDRSGSIGRFRVDVIIREQVSHTFVYVVLLQDDRIIRARWFSG